MYQHIMAYVSLIWDIIVVLFILWAAWNGMTFSVGIHRASKGDPSKPKFLFFTLPLRRFFNRKGGD
jgi:hypothetical protein